MTKQYHCFSSLVQSWKWWSPIGSPGAAKHRGIGCTNVNWPGPGNIFTRSASCWSSVAWQICSPGFFEENTRWQTPRSCVKCSKFQLLEAAPEAWIALIKAWRTWWMVKRTHTSWAWPNCTLGCKSNSNVLLLDQMMSSKTKRLETSPKKMHEFHTQICML